MPKNGVKLTFPGKIELCRCGFHASREPFDALHFSPRKAHVLCLVECEGPTIESRNKLVCGERTIIARMDANPLLEVFTREMVLSVVDEWDPPQIVLDFLMGDSSLKVTEKVSSVLYSLRMKLESSKRSGCELEALDVAMSSVNSTSIVAAIQVASRLARLEAKKAELKLLLQEGPSSRKFLSARGRARVKSLKNSSQLFSSLVGQAFEDWLPQK